VSVLRAPSDQLSALAQVCWEVEESYKNKLVSHNQAVDAVIELWRTTQATFDEDEWDTKAIWELPVLPYVYELRPGGELTLGRPSLPPLVMMWARLSVS